MKKIELKVSIHCHKCKTEVLKSVTKLEGIDQVSVDANKGTLTVIGDVDRVSVTNQVRKTGKVAEIISVGPPKVPEKKPDPSCNPQPCISRCNDCQFVAVGYAPYDSPSCSIL